MVLCDSQSGINLMKNLILFTSSKHIDVKLHFKREIVDYGLLFFLEKIEIEINPFDGLNMVLNVQKIIFYFGNAGCKHQFLFLL